MKNRMKHNLFSLLLFVAFACSALPLMATSTDVWNIDSGLIDPTHYFGETVANGMIGILSSAIPFRTQQTMLYGAYEKLWPDSVSCNAESFNFLDLSVSIDGVLIDRPEQVSNFHQVLQMKDAAISTSFDYQDKATITYAIRALRQLPNTAMMEVTILPKRPISVEVTSRIDAPERDDAPSWYNRKGLPWLNDIKNYPNEVQVRYTPRWDVSLASVLAKGPTGTLSIAAAQGFAFDESPTQAPRITRKDGGLSFTKNLSAAERYHFALIGSTITSAHVSDPLNEVQRLAVSAIVRGTQALVEQHNRAWDELWKSDIRIQGDDATQRDVHSMIYHLYSFIRAGTGYSISPMGLSRSADGYMGHIFWDADTWMFPALLALHPELARTMLDYRYDRLPAARRNAAMNGYKGAQFPWESAATGEEDIWSFVPAFEIHITADVAIAAWEYYCVTQDREWLRERGYPLLKETADFWTSRVARNGSGHYDIDHVLAADEYADFVDNDAFTNAAAKENLADATKAARILSVKPNPDWELVRKNIPILKFPNGVTREHSTYHGEIIKQADVNLLAYPLQVITSPQAIRRDLEYYLPHYDKFHGPAMTYSVLAILYEKLGEPERALELFKAGYEPNKRPPFGAIAESAKKNNPYFATGAGGLLQSMLFGFGGLEITDHGLIQRPSRLPAAWKSLTLTGIGPQQRSFVVHSIR